MVNVSLLGDGRDKRGYISPVGPWAVLVLRSGWMRLKKMNGLNSWISDTLLTLQKSSHAGPVCSSTMAPFLSS